MSSLFLFIKGAFLKKPSKRSPLEESPRERFQRSLLKGAVLKGVLVKERSSWSPLKVKKRHSMCLLEGAFLKELL